MGAVWLVLAAKFRYHGRSWLLLSLLIGLASGFVLAAFPRYVASYGYDARPAVRPGGGRP